MSCDGAAGRRACAEIGQDLDRPAREQPVGLARRQLQPARGGRQGRPGPALEHGLGRHGVGQTVAQRGVGVAACGVSGYFLRSWWEI